MSRGVENNACVISLNQFETTSQGGFGESGSIRIQLVGADAAKPVRADSIVAVRTGLNSIIYISVQYTLLRCAIMTVLSLRKIQFYISGQYRAEVADTAVCTPDFAVLPSALSGSPH